MSDDRCVNSARMAQDLFFKLTWNDLTELCLDPPDDRLDILRRTDTDRDAVSRIYKVGVPFRSMELCEGRIDRPSCEGVVQYLLFRICYLSKTVELVKQLERCLPPSSDNDYRQCTKREGRTGQSAHKSMCS